MLNAPDPTETTQWMAAVFCPQCQTTFSPPSSVRIPSCPTCGRELPQADAQYNADDDDEFSLSSSVLPAEFAANLQPEDLLGRSLDLYSIRSLLGIGAMGWVYLAKHRRLQRSCALKILSPKRLAEDPQYVGRFLDEGRAAAALIHPNIVTVHAIGEANNFYFLEMEFVAGRSLRMLIDEEGPLSPERATAITLRIAQGLAAAHKAGILHRDLKPDNVLLTHQRVPKSSTSAWRGGACCRRRRGRPPGIRRHSGVYGAGDVPRASRQPGQRRVRPGRQFLPDVDRPVSVQWR